MGLKRVRVRQSTRISRVRAGDRRVLMITIATHEGLLLGALDDDANVRLLAAMLRLTEEMARADAEAIVDLVKRYGAERVAAFPVALGAVAG